MAKFTVLPKEKFDEIYNRASEDCISRQAAIEKILGQPPEAHYPSWYARQIEDLPPAEPKTGKWTNVVDGIEYTWGTCDTCGVRIPMAYKYYEYCPHCGADMREVTA